jgi:Transglutaminase-like superfamily/Domain of unknown function (DUF4129)
MGVIVFFIVLIAAIYWLSGFFRSISPISSRREAFALGYPRATTTAEPIVTPVADIKIPERLPQISVDFVPILAPIPPVDRSTETAPNFTTIESLIEESRLFRSLTLGMFVLSVISVDVAAGTHYSWVGIPFTTVGAIWSWYRRHHPKHWLNIAVSVASLAIVFGLVPSLVGQVQMAIDQVAPASKMSATLALTLGLLMVALQMGLSFHLYNRRLLGYCLVVSSILIGVAAGLSQNISFLILLCGWISIAIPTLMLDYRSRLALKPVGIAAVSTPAQLSYRHLPWKYLSQLAAISIGLGLILAVFLPNFRLPDLSFKPPGLNRGSTLAPKSSPPPLPAISSAPPPTIRAVAAKVLGQPGNNNYPDIIKQENLQLPPELSTQLQASTQKILATSPQPLNSDFDRAAYLGDYLKQRHQADSSQLNSPNQPPIDSKSIRQLLAKCTDAPQTCKLGGNKQDIPVVYTAMLRSVGIPARLKTGDQLAQIDPQTKLYPRPTAQDQSQTEVYFPNWGWLGLDATPVDPLVPSGVEVATPNADRPLLNLNAQQLAQLQSQSEQIAPSPSTTPTLPHHPRSQPNSPHSIDPSPSPSSPPTPSESPPGDLDPAILKTIIAIIAMIGGIAWYLWYRRQQQQQLAQLHPIDRIYRSMVLSLSKQGRSRLPTQTQLEYARTIGQTEHPQIAKVVWEISQSYTAWRYGKQRIDPNQLTKKLQYLHHLQQLAAQRQRQQWMTRVKALWTPKNSPKPHA